MRVVLVLALVCAGAAGAQPLAPVVRDIFPAQSQHVHSSSIVECPNGDWLAVWFQGSGERSANDVKVNGARLRKGASAWSEVFQAADTPGFPDCNPVLFLDRNQKLWLFWCRVLANRWECGQLMCRGATEYIQDGPPQWSWQDCIVFDPGDAFAGALEDGFNKLDIGRGMWGEYALPYTRLMVDAAKDPYKRQTGWMTRIHPCQLPSGRMLLPLYSDGFNLSLVALSDDDGVSWRPSMPIVGAGPVQPSIVRKNDGTLAAYMRDGGDAPPRVLKAESSDEGETWSPARDTDIPNPGSSLEVIRLRDGRWVMICNDTAIGRTRLSALMSDDEGATWKWQRVIEPLDDAGKSFAYPSVMQGGDGNIHLSYSHVVKEGGANIRYTVVDPEWIAAAQ